MRPQSVRRRPDAESDEDDLDGQGDEIEGGEADSTDTALYCFCNERSYGEVCFFTNWTVTILTCLLQDDRMRQWQLSDSMGQYRSNFSPATNLILWLLVSYGLRWPQASRASRYEVVLFPLQREPRRPRRSGCRHFTASSIQQTRAQKGKTCVIDRRSFMVLCTF